MFFAGKGFACRQCLGLAYESQNETTTQRLVRRRNELGKRLFANFSGARGWGKRPGMHWKTYYRLLSEYEAIEQRWCAAVMNELEGLGMKID